jgi:hypothetical protein
MTGMRDLFGTGYCVRDERFARGLIGQTNRWAKSAHSIAAKAEPTTRPVMACEVEKLARSNAFARVECPMCIITQCDPPFSMHDRQSSDAIYACPCRQHAKPSRGTLERFCHADRSSLETGRFERTNRVE